MHILLAQPHTVYSDGTSYTFVYTVLYIFAFCSQFLTTTTSYFKAFSSLRCQRMSESMDFTSEITDSVKWSLHSQVPFILLYENVLYDAPFPLWYRTRDEASGEQSKSEKISPWSSPTNVSYHRLPSSVCQTNAQNADRPLDRTDIVWGSNQCRKIWCGSWSQSDTVISLLVTAARPIRCITGAETLLLISHGMNMQT